MSESERGGESLRAKLQRKAAEARQHGDEVTDRTRQELRRGLNDDLERRRSALIYPRDSVFVPGAGDQSETTARSAVIITEYRDVDGNQFYTATPATTHIEGTELQQLRDQIVNQKAAFSRLDGEARRSMLDGFRATDGQLPDGKPYADHLRSEVIRTQFVKLKGQ